MRVFRGRGSWVFLVSVLLPFTSVSRADTMSITYQGPGGAGDATGKTGEATLGISLDQVNRLAEGTRLVQGSGGFVVTLTDILFTCPEPSDFNGQDTYSFSFTVLSVGHLNWWTGDSATLTLDGRVDATDGWAHPITVNGYAYLKSPDDFDVFQLSVGTHPTASANGAFASDASDSRRLADVIDHFRMDLVVSGLKPGDVFRMPGSMGLSVAPPPTAAAPEPGGLDLLLTSLAATGLIRWARKRRPATSARTTSRIPMLPVA